MYGLFGSGKWGANISMPLEHLAAIEKLRIMHLKMVVASHDYHPYGYLAKGDKEIRRYLDTCVDALHGIKKRICENPSLSKDLYTYEVSYSGLKIRRPCLADWTNWQIINTTSSLH